MSDSLPVSLHANCPHRRVECLPSESNYSKKQFFKMDLFLKLRYGAHLPPPKLNSPPYR